LKIKIKHTLNQAW